MRVGTIAVLGLALAASGLGCATVSGQTPYLTRNDLAEVTVQNTLPTTACHVWLTQIDSGDWGRDWLNPAELMLAGSSRTFRVPRGHWDLRASGCDGRELVTAQSILVGPGGATISLASPPPPEMQPAPSGGEAPAPAPGGG